MPSATSQAISRIRFLKISIDTRWSASYTLVMTSAQEIAKAARRAGREDRVDALRDGRKVRAAYFTPRKGKGSYKRRGKHASAQD